MGCVHSKKSVKVDETKKIENRSKPEEQKANSGSQVAPLAVSSDPKAQGTSANEKPKIVQGNDKSYSEKTLMIEGNEFFAHGHTFDVKVHVFTKSGKHEIGQMKLVKGDGADKVSGKFPLTKVPKSEEGEIKVKLELVYNVGNTFKYKIDLKPGQRSVQKDFGNTFEIFY